MKQLLTLVAILFMFGVQSASAERAFCTDQRLTVDNVRRHCENRCWDEGREFRGWRCGSDISCGRSACECLCSDQRKEKRHHKKDDSGSIEIPLGDKFKIQIPVE